MSPNSSACAGVGTGIKLSMVMSEMRAEAATAAVINEIVKYIGSNLSFYLNGNRTIRTRSIEIAMLSIMVITCAKNAIHTHANV